jgi:hypothetical protein
LGGLSADLAGFPVPLEEIHGTKSAESPNPTSLQQIDETTGDPELLPLVPTSDEDEDGVAKPIRGIGRWGRGHPLKGTVAGKTKWFADGAGLCSPGRWAPEARTTENSGLSANIRSSRVKLIVALEYKKLCCELACGRCKSSPFNEEMVMDGRKALLDHTSRFVKAIPLWRYPRDSHFCCIS